MPTRFKPPQDPLAEVPPELRPANTAGIVLSQWPSSFDQMRIYLDEVMLELEPSSLEEQLVRVKHLPFELGSIVLAKIGMHADHARATPIEQLGLAEQVFKGTVVWPRMKALLENDRGVVFVEQHFFALMRMLVLYGVDAPMAQNLTPNEWALMSRSLLGMGTVADAGLTDERKEDGWLAYLVQNGAYNHHEPAMEQLARAYALFIEIPELEDLKAHPDYVPLDEWLRTASGGLGVLEQFAVGFGLLARTKALDEDVGPNDRGVLPADYVDGLAAQAGVSPEALAGLLSADRGWYRDVFSADAGPSQMWNRIPFEQRPLLQLSDGRAVLWHTRALMSWLTDGLYYRSLDAARALKKASKFTRFMGAVTERYALELLREAHPGPRPLGAGVVHGDRSYSTAGGQKRTPDVVIDYGPDLVLVEVCSSRLRAESRLTGDPKLIRADLDRMLGDKLEQLGRRTAELARGDVAIPGVDMNFVERIWPVVVTGAGLMDSEMLWDYIDAHTVELRRIARVQPLTPLDLSDLELLTSLVESGRSIPGLLARKTGSVYARIDFRRFAHDDPYLEDALRSTAMRRRYQTMSRKCVESLGFDGDRFEQDVA